MNSGGYFALFFALLAFALGIVANVRVDHVLEIMASPERMKAAKHDAMALCEISKSESECEAIWDSKP